MNLFRLSTLILTLLACCLQLWSPPFEGLLGARLMIVPLVFACCAATLEFSPMLILAFITGFLWDAANHLSPVGGDPEIYKHFTDNLPFGYSIVLYGLMGSIAQGVQPLFKRGVWQISTLLVGIIVFFYLLSDFLTITFIRGEFIFPPELLMRIWISASITMLCTPLVFTVLRRIARLCNHTIEYKGLHNSYFKANFYQLNED